MRQAKYVVNISFGEGKGYVCNFFKDLKAAETALNEYCMKQGMTARFTLRHNEWMRIQVKGITIDFDTINENTYSTIFDLQ